MNKKGKQKIRLRQKIKQKRGKNMNQKRKRKKSNIKPSTYIEIEEACNHLYVGTEEIKIILGGVSTNKANAWRQELEEQLEQEHIESLNEKDEKLRLRMQANCFYYNDTKPHKLPIRRVLEKAHIDLDYVRREANKMRKALKIEGKYGKEF